MKTKDNKEISCYKLICPKCANDELIHYVTDKGADKFKCTSCSTVSLLKNMQFERAN